MTKLCIVGPMLGLRPGYATSQGQVLAALFRAEGAEVTAVSSHISPAARAAEILSTLLLGRNRFDTVLLEIYGGRGFIIEDAASMAAKMARKKLVMALHGGDMPNFMKKFPGWTRRVLSRADALTAPSAYLAEAVRSRGLTARIIPNAVDLREYPFKHRTRLSPRLFWMRSFHPSWDPLMAVEVLALVRKKRPDASLVMAGMDKGYLEETRKKAGERGVLDAVRFPGFLNTASKRREAETADIFLNTNRIDNMPVAVIEAWAFGLPVVSTDAGGLPYMIRDNSTGLLVRTGDANAMAERVLRLLDDTALAARLSQEGRRAAETSDWARVRAQWQNLLSELAV
jgi:L-malate glycosyltransferase